MIANMPRVIAVRNRRASGYARPRRADSARRPRRSRRCRCRPRYAVTRYTAAAASARPWRRNSGISIVVSSAASGRSSRSPRRSPRCTPRCRRRGRGTAAPASAPADRDQHRPEHHAVRIRPPKPKTVRSDDRSPPRVPEPDQRRRGRGRGGGDVADGLDHVDAGDPDARATMVTVETASPIANPVTTVDQSNVNVRCSAFTSRPELRIWSARQAMSHPNAMPSSAPSALGDHRVDPSFRGEPGHQRDRRIPTVRSIPSSERRSSTSITNTLTSRRIPAATANIPIVK